MSIHRLLKSAARHAVAAVVSILPACCAQGYIALCCGPAGSVSSFSTATNQVTPNNITINAAGDHVYGTHVMDSLGANRVYSVDLTSGKVALASLPNTQLPSLEPVAVSPDGKTLYVGSATKNALTIFDAATLAQTGSLSLTASAGNLTITPDGKTLAVLVYGNSYAVDLVNLATRMLTVVTLPHTERPFGLVLSPDAPTLYVNAGDVYAIDMTSATISGTANTRSQTPYGIAITPDGSTLYATDLAKGLTSVVAAASLTVTGHLQTLSGAYAIAISPQGQGYVLNENGSGLMQVDTAAMKVVGVAGVGAGPSQVVLNSTASQAFVLDRGSGNVTAINHPASKTSVHSRFDQPVDHGHDLGEQHAVRSFSWLSLPDRSGDLAGIAADPGSSAAKRQQFGKCGLGLLTGRV